MRYTVECDPVKQTFWVEDWIGTRMGGTMMYGEAFALAENLNAHISAAREEGRREAEAEKHDYESVVSRAAMSHAECAIGPQSAMRAALDAVGHRELLEACEEAVNLYCNPGGPLYVSSAPGGWLDRARDAIAKCRRKP